MSCFIPFSWETMTVIIVWISLFLTPYNLIFHHMKLFDSIRELATRGGERGWGESGSTVKIAASNFQIWNSQNGFFSLVVILYSEQQWQRNNISYHELFIQYNNQETNTLSFLDDLLTSQYLLAFLTQSIIFSQLDPLKLWGICSKK